MADQKQLDIEAQINQAIADRAALLDNQRKMIADQIALAQELCRAMECKELDGYNERIRETREGMLAATDATDETTKSNQNMERQIKKSSKTMNFFKGVAVGAAVVVKNAFGMLFKTVKALGGFIKTSLTGAFKIVKFAISGWSKMLGAMAQKGMEAANAGIGLRNAYENVKHTFGGLTSKEGSSVIGVFDKMRQSSGNVAGTGIRLSKIFGKGPDGLAAALDYVSEVAEGMGPIFERLHTQFEEAADEVLVLGRSLGFAGEDFATLGVMAGYAGESLKETLGRLQREIVTVSENLGVNSKAMADNMKTMMKSPLVFGTTTKELLKTSVAAQKLGVSIEALQGTMGAFDDFESAAQNAADLASEFGVMVDATEMMSAASPEEQFVMLKDALQESGKSLDDMSRQERQRLAELTGMGDALFSAMDPSNAFDQDALSGVNDGVDAATKATKSQSAATAQLTKQMKLLHEAMDPMNTGKGFLGTFFQGMQEGLLRSKEGRAMLKGVTDAFREVLMAGREVGAMLAELFRPGAPLHFLYEYFTELPQRMREMMKEVKGAFEIFVADLNAGGDRATHAFKNLVANLKDAIFGESGGFGGALLEGFHFLGDLIVANMINLVPYILEGMIKMFEAATAMMRGETPKFAEELEVGTIMPMTQTAFAALLKDDVINEFGSAFMEMLRQFWSNYGEQISDFLGGVLQAVFIAAIMKSVIPLLMGGYLFKLAGAVFKAMGGIAGMIGNVGGSNSANEQGSPQKSFLTRLKEALRTLAGMDEGDIVKAGKNLLMIGGIFATGVLAVGALAAGLQALGVEPIMMAAVAGTMYAIAKVTEATAAVVKACERLPQDKRVLLKAAALITAVAAVFAAVIYMVTYSVKELAAIEFTDGLQAAAEAAGKIAMTGLIVTAGIVGLGAILMLLMTLGSNPVTGAILAAGLLAATLVFSAAMGLATGAVLMLAEMPAASAAAAKDAAEAAGMIIDTTLKVINMVWEIMKGIVWNSTEFNAILEDIKKVVKAITQEFIPLVNEAAEAYTQDPKEVKEKLETVVMLIDSFTPVTHMMTAAMKIKDAKPDEIANVVDKIGQGMSSVFDSAGELVKGITASIGGLTESQIKSAEAAGPALAAATNLLQSLMPQQSLFEDTMKKTYQYGMTSDGVFTNTYGMMESGEVVSKTAQAKQKEYIDTLKTLLSDIGEPMKDLITKVIGIEIEGDQEEIRKRMCTIATVMNTVASAGDAIMSTVSAMRGISGRKGGELTQADFDALRGFFIKTSDLLIGQPGVRGVVEIGTNIAMRTAEYTKKFTPRVVKDMAQTLEGFQTLSSLVGVSSDIGKIVKDSAQMFSDIGEYGDDVFTTQALEPLIDMIEAYNYLYEKTNGLLGSMPDLNAVLKQFGDRLSLTAEDISIKTQQVNIQISLNVTLDTKNIARALVEGEYMEADGPLRTRLDLPAKGKEAR